MSKKTEQLSRRDKLAGIAMHALIVKGGNITRYEIAYHSVKQADLLIAELSKKRA